MSEEQSQPLTAQQIAEQALEHLRSILSLSGLEGEASLSGVEGEVIHLDVQGPDAGLFIGRRGQTLDAVQYLLLVMVSHSRAMPGKLRIVLDADNYREKRSRDLQNLARDLAARVRQTGQEAVLEPLNALERRIVHTALMDDPDVETYSEGDEPNRHIVITPRRTAPAVE